MNRNMAHQLTNPFRDSQILQSQSKHRSVKPEQPNPRKTLGKGDHSHKPRAKLYKRVQRAARETRSSVVFNMFVCNVCGQSFESKLTREYHSQVVHQKWKERPTMMCAWCRRRFSSFATLEAHLRASNCGPD